MINSLRKNVIPIMRNGGFEGSFPHFYRRLEDRVDLLMFQLSALSGVFSMEASKYFPEGHIHVFKTFGFESIISTKKTVSNKTV